MLLFAERFEYVLEAEKTKAGGVAGANGDSKVVKKSSSLNGGTEDGKSKGMQKKLPEKVQAFVTAQQKVYILSALLVFVCHSYRLPFVFCLLGVGCGYFRFIVLLWIF